MTTARVLLAQRMRKLAHQSPARRGGGRAAVRADLAAAGPLHPRTVAGAGRGDQMQGIPIPEPTLASALGQYVKNVSQIVFLMGILVSMGAVVAEKERGTAAMVLSKPVSRLTFLLSKYVGLLLVVGAGFALGALGAYYYTLVLFTAPPLGAYLGLNALMFVYLALLMAVTFLASTVLKNQAAAGAVGFVAFVVLSLLGALPVAGGYERVGKGATTVLDAARLAVSLRRTRAAHLDELRDAVDLPLLYVPYLFVRDHGLRVTRMVADALGAELGL